MTISPATHIPPLPRMPTPFAMHAPLCHRCPLHHPCLPFCHTCPSPSTPPFLPCMSSLTMHAPYAMHTPLCHTCPLPVDRMTDDCENITFPQLLLWTVKTEPNTKMHSRIRTDRCSGRHRMSVPGGDSVQVTKFCQQIFKAVKGIHLWLMPHLFFSCLLALRRLLER